MNALKAGLPLLEHALEPGWFPPLLRCLPNGNLGSVRKKIAYECFLNCCGIPSKDQLHSALDQIFSSKTAISYYIANYHAMQAKIL